MVKCIIVICLLFIFYQDLRYKAVYWFLFPGLAGFLIADLYNQISMRVFLEGAILNIAFLSIQFLALFLWLTIKNRKVMNITANYLGWGDILFLCNLALYLHPMIFILFYMMSLVLTLVFVFVSSPRGDITEVHIPLAGYQSLLFAVLFVAFQLSGRSLVYDGFMSQYLNV